MTRLCRFNDNRLGVVENDTVIDVTDALQVLPAVRWPVPSCDLLIAHLDEVLEAVERHRRDGARHEIARIRFLSPVANPPKIIAAPVNYLKHQAEANADGGRNFAKNVQTIDTYGLFLKASSSVVGTSEGVEIAYPQRRNDHEIELVAVIGRGGRRISQAQALQHVAGYCLGLDMTLRGPEDRSLRKSLDSFAVVGPWLTTADEVGDPAELVMSLEVNGQRRQAAPTSDMICNVPRLIEYASAHYTLYPGDLIFTGTPEGVGEVTPGDVIHCSISRVGSATVNVFAAGAAIRE